MDNRFILFAFLTSLILNLSAQTIESKIIPDKMILIKSKNFINIKSERVLIYNSDSEDNLLFIYIDTLNHEILKPLYTINEFDYRNKEYINLIALNNHRTNFSLAPNAFTKAIVVQLMKEDSNVCKYYYMIMNNYLINKEINQPIYRLKYSYWKSKKKQSDVKRINNNTTYTYYIN